MRGGSADIVKYLVNWEGVDVIALNQVLYGRRMLVAIKNCMVSFFKRIY